MKLYYAPGACSLAPHIVLCESGLAFETEKVDLATKKTAAGTNFDTINPKSYVPALKLDNGEVLTEVAAVLQYLADLVPDKHLAPPPASFERVRLQEWLGFISSEIHKGFGPLWHPESEEAKNNAKARLGKRLSWLEPQFGQRSYLMGDTFTVADAYLFTVTNWTRFHHIPTSNWPHLEAYLARVAARPAVQAALKDEGLTS